MWSQCGFLSEPDTTLWYTFDFIMINQAYDNIKYYFHMLTHEFNKVSS